jgi:hypothetical protein
MAKSQQTEAGAHRATWAKDRRNGGYLVRVIGPNANRFGERRVDDGSKDGIIVRRKVPVTLKSGEQKMAELGGVVWTGKDEDTGQPVALYTHIPEQADEQDELPF